LPIPTLRKKETYEGISLEDLLKKAGVTNGEQMRGPAMTSCVLAEAADNYRVVFSLAELDSGILDSEIIVADTMDGAPLPLSGSSPCLPSRLVALPQRLAKPDISCANSTGHIMC